MIPELFSIGPISISPFGVLLVLAFFSGYAQLRWGLRRLGCGNEDDGNVLLIAAALGGLIGGKVYYAALYGDWHLLFNRAGIVFYGSMIGGALAMSWVIRRRSLVFAAVADAIAPGAAIGYGVGRIGCLLVGDDYGVPTDLPWGMTFPEGPIKTTAGALRRNFDLDIPAELGVDELVAVHPTQVYESLAGIAIWLVGRSLIKRRLRRGTVALCVFGLLATERFLVEFLRAKDDRFFGPLTLAQVISLAILLIVVVVAIRARSAPAPQAAQA